jgi:hypothetical protein
MDPRLAMAAINVAAISFFIGGSFVFSQVIVEACGPIDRPAISFLAGGPAI